MYDKTKNDVYTLPLSDCSFGNALATEMHASSSLRIPSRFIDLLVGDEVEEGEKEGI